MVKQLFVETQGQGLYEITEKVRRHVEVDEGLCTLFVRHTSASLVIQENADPAAKQDLGRKLALGTWQGIYLWEHRRQGSRRELVLHVGP